MKRGGTYGQTMRLDLLLQSPESTPPSEAPSAADNTPIDNTAGTSDFSVLLDSLYDAAILTDYAGSILTANGRALSFFAMEEENLPGLTIAELISGADAHVLATISENVQTNRFTLLQAYCTRSDQTSFPAEISVTRLSYQGDLCLCFFVRDITMRMRAEENLRIEGEAIRNAGNGIAICTPDGYISYANPAMCILWECEEEGGLTGSSINSLFSEDSGIEQAMAMAASRHTWSGELTRVSTEGQTRFLQTSITASFDEENTLTHTIYSFTDITQRRQDEMALIRYQDQLEDLIRERTAELEATNQTLQKEVEERKQVEEQLREAIRQLEAHDHAKSAFVSNVSHELRTPLTSLIHSIENLMRGVTGPIPSAVFSYLTMMLEDCWRLDRTIADILDLSRIETGTLHLRRHLTPFARLAARTAESVRISAEDIPITLEVDEHLPVGYADCDASKIERVLLNILSNALKFTPPGGRVQVTFELIQKGDTNAIACIITDTGIGIPADFLDRVTERFFRIGEQVGGTGLGLAIAKEIAERHAGGLEIRSPVPGTDTGTQVRIWIPRTAPPPVLLAMPASPAQKQYLETLRESGYSPDCAYKGSEALQVLRDKPYLAVILDGNLENMSASETILHIKADPTLRNLSLLFLQQEALTQATQNLLDGFHIHILPATLPPSETIETLENSFLSNQNDTINGGRSDRNHNQSNISDGTDSS